MAGLVVQYDLETQLQGRRQCAPAADQRAFLTAAFRCIPGVAPSGIKHRNRFFPGTKMNPGVFLALSAWGKSQKADSAPSQQKEKPMVRFPIPLSNLHAWKSWSNTTDPAQGIIKRNWVPTGRIDLSTRFNGGAADVDQPSEFKLMVEERRIVESVTGLENLE